MIRFDILLSIILNLVGVYSVHIILMTQEVEDVVCSGARMADRPPKLALFS